MALDLTAALRTEQQTDCTAVIWIAIATDIRRGEVLGLIWRNVDFERKRVYVGRQHDSDHMIRNPKVEKMHR